MSFYHRNAMGDATTSAGFTLDADNIDTYRDLSLRMHKELAMVKSMVSLEARQAKPDPDDALYTPEFIASRLSKLQRNWPKDKPYLDEYKALYLQLCRTNAEIDVVFPQAMAESATQEISQKMEELNDRRIELEDKITTVLSDEFSVLKESLPKIYFMILEGVDISTMEMCFKQMKMVLSGSVSADNAVQHMMQTSIRKYNLPENIYDHMKKKGSKH